MIKSSLSFTIRRRLCVMVDNPPAIVRPLVFSLAMTSLFAGCAHQSVPEQPAKPEKSSASAGLAGDMRQRNKAAMLDDVASSKLTRLAESLSSSSIVARIAARQREAAKQAAARNAHWAKTGKRLAGGKPPSALAEANLGSFSKVNQGLLPGLRDPWRVLRNRMRLTGIQHESVSAKLYELKQHPGAVQTLMRRTDPYLGYLLEEINRHGLPADLVIVPMVESAFQVNAVSPKSAAGIWQFVPSTGQQYGLEVRDDYDARFDIAASTQAACRYLRHLSDYFRGDWLLALAAYNAGEGAVTRAMEASKNSGGSGSFWDLNLPAETKAYVPKILALAQLIAGMEPAMTIGGGQLAGESGLTRVAVSRDVPVTEVIRLAKLSSEAFQTLNPKVKTLARSRKRTLSVLLPSENAGILASSLGLNHQEDSVPTVVVRKGETLAILAKRHGVPEPKLAQWNGLKPSTRLHPGQEILLRPV